MNLNYLKETYHLTKTELHILDYLDKQVTLTADITIRKTATECFSSPTSIMRLAQKLNFSGFNELVYKLKESHASPQTGSDELPSLEKISAFCQLIEEYKHTTIIFLGTEFSTHLTRYMSDVFNFHYLPNITTSYTQLINNQKNQKNLFIVVSHSGEDKSLIQTLQSLHKQKNSVISFLGNTTNSIAELSDLTFSTDSYSPFLTTIAQPQLFFGRTLIIFEYLICAYINSQKNR